VDPVDGRGAASRVDDAEVAFGALSVVFREA
jgi:hypothetical protein